MDPFVRITGPKEEAGVRGFLVCSTGGSCNWSVCVFLAVIGSSYPFPPWFKGRLKETSTFWGASLTTIAADW